MVSKTKNLQYLAFAVKDKIGNCEGGVLEASGSGDKITATVKQAVPPGTACTGGAVSDLRGY